MKLVYWPLKGGLLYLVQRGGVRLSGAAALPGPSSMEDVCAKLVCAPSNSVIYSDFEWPVYNLDFKVMILFNVKGPTKIVQDNSYVGWTKLNRASAVSFLERILIIFGRRNNSSFTHFKGPFIATQLNWTQLNWPSWTAYSQSARSKSVVFCLWRHKRAVEFSWVKLSCVAINTP